MEEDDIRTLMKYPLMMFCTDGVASSNRGVLRKVTGYSPCSFGEYPYILERFVRERGVLTIEEAIRKMTSFPAQKLGFMG
jgi:N-acyl-D-amino-acid deacylase